MQDKAKAKLRVLEERAEEQRRQKAAADEEWRRQQRERELQRAKVIWLSGLGLSACLLRQALLHVLRAGAVVGSSSCMMQAVTLQRL